MFIDCLCPIFTAAENCVKVENEEFIQLSNDYNPCDGTNNKVYFSQTQNEFPRTSDMAQSSHMKKILTGDSVEPKRHDIVVNNHHLIGPDTSRGSSGTGIGESTVGHIQQVSLNADDDRRHQCQVCGLTLKTKKNLKKHTRIHTGEKPYKCSFCDKKFKSSYSHKTHELWHKGELPQCPVCGGRYTNLQCHMLTHDESADKNKHVCSVCKKGFRMADNLKSHMLIHLGEKPYTCQVCGLMLTTKKNLKRHMRIHTGEKPYKRECEVCGIRFEFRRSLVSHVRIHTGEKPYNCSFCDKKFRTKHENKMHELWHKGELPQCPVCGGRYTKLQTHMLTHDDSADKNKHVCSVCKKGFRIVSNLKAHMLIHSGEKPYTCQDCGGRFRTSTHLKIHMKTHTKEKNHVCSVCGSSFSLKGSLNSHMRTHSDERPYRCEACGKAFKQNAGLKNHQLTHQLTKTSEKRFICDTCGKQFRMYATLQIHSLIHSGVQPYECSVCGMKFNQSSSMKRHMLIHTGEKPYSCSDCGERFRQSSLLANHRRRHCAKNTQK